MEKTIFIVYTDDTILLGADKGEIDLLVKRLGKTFKIEDQGNLSDYLGIKIEKKPDGTLDSVNLERPQVRWRGNQGKTEQT